MAYIQTADSNPYGNAGASEIGDILGQTFVGDGRILHSVGFLLVDFSATPVDIYAYIYNLTGTPGTDGKPTGAAIATSLPVSEADLLGYGEPTKFRFIGDNKIVLEDGVNYGVGFLNTGGQNHRVDTNETYSGNKFYYENSVWFSSASNYITFYVYTRPLKNILPGNA